MVKVQVFYDATKIGYNFFKSVYDTLGLRAPTPQEMTEQRSKHESQSGRNEEFGWTDFHLPKQEAKELVGFFLNCPMGINAVEVSELETLV